MHLPKPRILIVEDEVLLAAELEMILSSHYEIVGPAGSYAEANKLLATDQPDLALLDIQLKVQEDGIALAREINAKHHIPFIFLTSHAEQLNQAKQVRPYAFLLKPYDERELYCAIELALSNYEQNKVVNTPEHIDFATEDNRVIAMRDSLFLKKDTAFQRVKLGDISHLEADNNYTTIYTLKGRFVYSTVLKNIEAKLPRSQFIRVHRSHVVNLNAIVGYEGNRLFLQDKKIPVSKQYREEVFRLFQAL